MLTKLILVTFLSFVVSSLAFSSAEEYQTAASFFAKAQALTAQELAQSGSKKTLSMHCIDYNSPRAYTYAYFPGQYGTWYSRKVTFSVETDPIMAPKASIALDWEPGTFPFSGRPGRFFSVLTFSTGDIGWSDSTWRYNGDGMELYTRSAGIIRKSSAGLVLFYRDLEDYKEGYCWEAGK